MLKTSPQDPAFAEHFGTRKRALEIQVQGKFLKPNASDAVVFIGGEIKGDMKLGAMARGIASLMLKMVK
jgi:hypothetical protein|tara:strand:+ start:648 stop:854 length:207 start_codon:yes stop_codon:yes gene_type:complete